MQLPPRFHRLSIALLAGAILLLLVGPANPPPLAPEARVRVFTRPYEFDYTIWTLNALGVKLRQGMLGPAAYLDAESQRQVVLQWRDLVGEIQQTEDRLREIYADPAIEDPEAVSASLRAELATLEAQRRALAPVAENVLELMVAAVASEMDLTLAGQPVPPVLYHTSPLPWALILSPRERIEQVRMVSLQTDTTLEQHIALEETVAAELGFSALVVPVGGIGTYPTMVIQTTNLNFLAEVVAHEWLHNFLTLRPLGYLYNESPELRIINETVANLAGKEIGGLVIERYFPEFAPPPPAPPSPTPEATASPAPHPAEPPSFDFRAEMRATRVTVDALLAEGRIEEAEAYMEARRAVFWENGYRIRKLNQAYFAFHGAYADVPGGAAGDDPVGAAVRQLRAESASLAEFVKRISWVTSYEDLLELLAAE